MARKRSSDEGGGYSWMDTYGDMVTLLLTFFIMLFSMSSVDAEKWEVLVKAFSRNREAETQQVVLVPEGDGDNIAVAMGEYDLMVNKEIDVVHERPVTLSELYEFMKAYIDQNDMSASVSIEKDAANNVYLRFDNNIFFDGNSSILRQESFPILQFMGECLKSVEDQIFVVRVSGHTATIQGDERAMVNDWNLSSSRANSVANYFEDRCEFDPKRLMTNGWGRNHPRYPNDTEENRAKNRRVEIMVLGNEFDTGNADQLYDILQKMVEGGTVEDPQNGSNILQAEQGTADEASESSVPEEISSTTEGTESAPEDAASLPEAGAPPETAPQGMPDGLTAEDIKTMTPAELEAALNGTPPTT